MKPLSLISTVVLSCLVLAAPAVAAEPVASIHLTIEPVEISSNSPNLTYTVTGESEPTRKYEVRFCQGPKVEVAVVFGGDLSSNTFNVPYPSTFTGEPGIYVVCATVTDNNSKPAESSASFTVVEHTKEEKAAAEAKAESEAKAAGEARAKAEAEATAKKKAEEEQAKKSSTSPLTPAQVRAAKLTKALKQCKKLKPKSKRVKCEKRAHKQYKRK